MKIDYDKIYEYLETQEGEIVSYDDIIDAAGASLYCSGIIVKLRNEGKIARTKEKGFYLVNSSHN
jgi:hypothetical protein